MGNYDVSSTSNHRVKNLFRRVFKLSPGLFCESVFFVISVLLIRKRRSGWSLKKRDLNPYLLPSQTRMTKSNEDAFAVSASLRELIQKCFCRIKLLRETNTHVYKESFFTGLIKIFGVCQTPRGQDCIVNDNTFQEY